MQAKRQPADLEERLSVSTSSLGFSSLSTVLGSGMSHLLGLPGDKRQESCPGPFVSGTLQGVLDHPVGTAAQSSVPWSPASVLTGPGSELHGALS